MDNLELDSITYSTSTTLTDSDVYTSVPYSSFITLPLRPNPELKEDYVKVIRCQNCIHCKQICNLDGTTRLECLLTDTIVEENDFCSCGRE